MQRARIFASMTKTPKRPRDLNEWAKRMVDIATFKLAHYPQDKIIDALRVIAIWDSTASYWLARDFAQD